MDTLLPSRPESYSEIIGSSLRLYGACFSRVIVLSLLLSITAFIPRFVSLMIGQELFQNLPPFSPERIWLLLINIVGMMFFIGIIWRMHCVAAGSKETLGEDIQVGMRKVLSVFFACMLQSLLILLIGGAIFLLQVYLHHHNLLFTKNFLGILFTVLIFFIQFALIIDGFSLFIFLPPIITVENTGILTSLFRSAALVWNHWWRVFSVQYTPWIFYLLLLSTIRFVLHVDVHIYYLEHGPHTLFGTIFNVILFALFIPWIPAVLLVQLRDLELRKNMHAT